MSTHVLFKERVLNVSLDVTILYCCTSGFGGWRCKFVDSGFNLAVIEEKGEGFENEKIMGVANNFILPTGYHYDEQCLILCLCEWNSDFLDGCWCGKSCSVHVFMSKIA